jgi:hypothetical protein
VCFRGDGLSQVDLKKIATYQGKTISCGNLYDIAVIVAERIKSFK